MNLELDITLNTDPKSIPDEVVDYVLDWVLSDYETGNVDWGRVWDKVDGMELSDGRVVYISVVCGPAIDLIKRRVLKYRREC